MALARIVLSEEEMDEIMLEKGYRIFKYRLGDKQTEILANYMAMQCLDSKEHVFGSRCTVYMKLWTSQ